jgi:hypothetical protein
MDLEVFIITNGRSTFPYVKKAMEGQSIDLKITVLENMNWVDALNRCLGLCESTHYVRCDDDFILHPLAIEYVWEKCKRKPNSALWLAKLWEDWTNKVAGGIKIYNKEVVLELGGFQASHLGKVDKMFKKQLDKSRFSMSGCKDSIVGLHACGKWKEQLRYEKLWSAMAKRPYQKTTHAQMAKYKKSVKEQYKMRTKFIEKKNKAKKTDFYKFIQDKKAGIK